ncbi:MAG TPA: Zn-ribbon domain-containing OB-fold protein [Acidimicrobiales bacterium]|nr:Zn-ribbon domain-containing OB-fold protein [Acidimicrobiales bacterium]
MEIVADWTDPRFAGRPRPGPDLLSAEFYAAADRGELRYQECPDCGHRQFYPRLICTGCGGEPAWAVASGRGTVHTFTVVRQNLSPPFVDLLPYVLAIVELEEGPRMMGNVTDCDPADVHIGLPVEAYGVRVEDGLALPFWRPAG